MANLSELIIRNQSKPTKEILHQAEAWALQGLQITMRAKEKLPHINDTCELAFAVALFNVAALRRVSGPVIPHTYFIQYVISDGR